MKTDSQVRQKIKQVLFRYRKKFVRDGLARSPENCSFNEPLSTPQDSEPSTIRVCRFVDSSGRWNNVVCDVAFGGTRHAESCPYFACRNTVDSLKLTFRKRWEGTPMEIGRIAKDFPDVAALMWAMAPPPSGDDVLSIFGEGSDNAD